MKKLLILLAALSLVACGSKEPKEDMVETPPVVVEKAPVVVEETAAVEKEGMIIEFDTVEEEVTVEGTITVEEED